MCKIIPIGGKVCPECEGSGDKLFNIIIGTDGYSEKEFFDCPTCDGKGYVFEESGVSDERWD